MEAFEHDVALCYSSRYYICYWLLDDVTMSVLLLLILLLLILLLLLLALLLFL